RQPRGPRRHDEDRQRLRGAPVTDRLDRDRLIEEAVEAAGTDDFGADTWQEGLDVLLALRDEAQLNELGVEVAVSDVVGYLTARAGITAYRQAHPEVAEAPIEHPIVI